MSINLGILGFGRIGAEHAAWVSKSSGIRVEAVADPTDARRGRARDAGFRTCSTLPELLNDPAIDAILVATPSAMHFDHASAALSAGKHVMVEKPMAMDLEQARGLVDLAKANQRILSVFHNRRWDIDYLTVKGAIASGTLGKVINVESRIHQWSSCVGPAAKEYRPNWRNEASFGGGGLYDWGSHLVDQLWRLMLPASPQTVFAQLRGNVWSTDCDDFARVCINFDNGAIGMVEINTTTTRPLPRWRIDGTQGSAEAPTSPTYDTREWAQLRFANPAGLSKTCSLAAPGLSEADIWSRFAAAIDGECDPAVSAESVLGTMCLLDAARRSSDEGIAVSVVNSVRWVE